MDDTELRNFIDTCKERQARQQMLIGRLIRYTERKKTTIAGLVAAVKLIAHDVDVIRDNVIRQAGEISLIKIKMGGKL